MWRFLAWQVVWQTGSNVRTAHCASAEKPLNAQLCLQPRAWHGRIPQQPPLQKTQNQKKSAVPIPFFPQYALREAAYQLATAAAEVR